ncbi:Reverse transcriptase RNA-dependent DNA polymerase [Trinorchestia longiramus]|nr:Reverse transcriptase RNA-dependent DNA polymerase [Trinorchestia longiramus]
MRSSRPLFSSQKIGRLEPSSIGGEVGPYSPVVRFESVRAVLALAAKHNLQLHHMDVATAFLNGELSEEIYLTQPEGFVLEGNENLVCRLNKSLYGLKQSPKCWNTSLDGHLKQLGFKQSKNDACIYTRVCNKGLCIIAVYVDDIIIASDCIDEINEVKSYLSAKYKMKDLGKLSYFLGVSVMQTKNEVFLEQCAYTKALLSRFGMDNANSVATPVDLNADLVTTSDEVEGCDKNLYQSAVGSLLYLSTRTRSDITYAVNNVAKYCSKPRKNHWTCVKRTFRYMKGNMEIDRVYCPSNDMLADIFTKGLSAEKFSRLRRKLGVVFFEKHIQCEKEC